MGILNCIKFGQAVVLSGKSLSDYVNINTLFIAVAVLAVIILIMIINYFATIKPNLSSNAAGNTAHSNNSVDNVLAQITQHEEDELINDCELVAVITAAIIAFQGDAAPADGFVVRSIKRANSRKWMNA